MAWEVAWTNAAWSDLEATADHIAKDSLHYAAGFVYEVKEAASSLTHFAERGHIVPEFNDPKIRELFVGNYRLIYQVMGKNVYVIAFVHGARDLWRLWERSRKDY